MLKTFEQWSRLGYKIKKGSKAHWVNNIPMFDDTQVSENNFVQSDYDYEDDAEQAFLYEVSPWGNCA